MLFTPETEKKLVALEKLAKTHKDFLPHDFSHEAIEDLMLSPTMLMMWNAKETIDSLPTGAITDADDQEFCTKVNQTYASFVSALHSCFYGKNQEQILAILSEKSSQHFSSSRRSPAELAFRKILTKENILKNENQATVFLDQADKKPSPRSCCNIL